MFRTPGGDADDEAAVVGAAVGVAVSVESVLASASVGAGVMVVVGSVVVPSVVVGVGVVVMGAVVDSRICCEGMLLLHRVSGTLVLKVQCLERKKWGEIEMIMNVNTTFWIVVDAR